MENIHLLNFLMNNYTNVMLYQNMDEVLYDTSALNLENL